MTVDRMTLPLRPRWIMLGDLAAEVLLYGLFALGIVYRGLPDIEGRAEAWLLCALLGSWVLVRFAAGALPGSAVRWGALAGAALWPALWGGVQLLRFPAGTTLAFSGYQATLWPKLAGAGVAMPAHLSLAIRPDRAVDGVVEAAACGAFLLAALLVAESRRGALRLAVAISTVGILEGLSGLVQGVLTGGERSTGSLVNPNHFAAKALMGLVVAVGLARTLSRRRSHSGASRPDAPGGRAMALLALASLAALGWVFALSRGSLLLGGGAAAVWFLHRNAADRARRAGRARTLASRLALPAGGACALLALVWILLEDPRSTRLLDLGTETADRMLYAKAMLDALPHSPVFGFGYGAAEPLLLQFASYPTSKNPIYAHNDWVQWLVEMGLIGFGVWVALAFAAAKPCLRDWRADAAALGSRRMELRAAALVAVAGALAHALVDFHLRLPAVAFMFLACLALALSRGAGFILPVRR